MAVELSNCTCSFYIFIKKYINKQILQHTLNLLLKLDTFYALIDVI